MGMGCRHEPHSSPATGGPLLFVFLNMMNRVTWGLVPPTNYPEHSIITVDIPDEGPVDQAGVVSVLELIRDLEPVVPLAAAAEAEGEAEVGPGVGHGRVGEDGVLAHLHHAALADGVMQLGVWEEGVIGHNHSPYNNNATCLAPSQSKSAHCQWRMPFHGSYSHLPFVPKMYRETLLLEIPLMGRSHTL